MRRIDREHALPDLPCAVERLAPVVLGRGVRVRLRELRRALDQREPARPIVEPVGDAEQRLARGREPARTQGKHMHVLPLELVPQRNREVQQKALGCGISGLQRYGVEARKAGDVDDGKVPLRLAAREHAVRQAHRCLNVEPHDGEQRLAVLL